VKSGGLRTRGIIKQSLEDMPLITVITVVRNGEKTLEETILSVINQTYKNIEYIIVDGASTDNTLDIIRKYEDRVDYWISEPDEGVFDAMNKSISFSRGNYIGFLNSGDYYEVNSVNIIVNAIEMNPGVDVIYGKTNLILFLWRRKYSYTITPSSTIDQRIKSGPVFCHQSSFVHINIFEKYGCFEKVKVTGDWLFFLKLYNKQVKFLYIDNVISDYADGGISTSVQGFKESFYYKRFLGTFKKIDYLRLAFFYVRGTKLYKRYIYPFRWILKIKIRNILDKCKEQVKHA
jgi:glycosyltransferase involved in cell wall biosynthesis